MMYGTRSLYDEKTIQCKKIIKEKRLELLQLMALNDDWHRDETSELYKKIMKYSKELRILTSDRWKIRRISKDEYIRLRNLGFTLSEVADYYAISVSYLNKWRQKNMVTV
ncbi:hypothetical protein [Enterococcus faecalis]|uniref:hypothetical protein n=1 Tax=Enterococcus faecalis TaxID=1351 RepID=UPI001F2C88CB|nr:hypothetical protein [Enterococcus faecalis]BDC77742.1 hypothetical protein EFK4_26450 [Enterococcus faecalis]